MILTIALRELRSMFFSPLAWAILGVLQAINAWIFFVNLDVHILTQAKNFGVEGALGVTDTVITPVFSLIGVLLMLVMPLLTMRLISEERHNKSLALLLSSPLPIYQIILGKFLSVVGFVLILLIIVVIMFFSLAQATSLDYGQIMASTLGALLLMSSFIAIGLYISCLTNHPTVAAVMTFGVLFMLWIVSWAVNTGESNADVILWVSMMQHQVNFQRGIINSGDVMYYLIIIVVFLLLSIRRLDAERLQS